MSNLSELKTLLSGIGGTPLASDTNDETIGKIASLAPEKMLPTVSTSDSGKVLTVNSSGEWEPSSGGGGAGGGVLVVHGTIEAGLRTTITLDKTAEEMETALTSCPFAVLAVDFGSDAGVNVSVLLTWEPYTEGSEQYHYIFESIGQPVDFYASSSSDYPVAILSDNGGGGGGVTPA